VTELLVTEPTGARLATLILAHGAGAPMDSGFMNHLSQGLAELGIATVRFEFPYMARRREEHRKAPPDRPPVLLEAWRRVYGQVRDTLASDQLLLIGGKSMGGRLATLVAEELQPAGFCCFGYPFFPPGKRDLARTAHFASLTVPGLILQGSRDTFGKPGEVDCSPWPRNIELVWLDEGDHDYRARKKSALSQGDIIAAAAARVAVFVASL
jgi:predicted alpha/beta-hydrolase family hydrolase